MHGLRVAAVCLVFTAAVAACGSSGSPPLAAPSAATPSSSVPSSAPTPSAAPIKAASVVIVAPAGPQVISLYEWTVVVPTAIKSGRSSFTISNYGTMPHELLVFKSNLAPSAYPTDKAGNIIEDGPGVALVSDGKNIDPAGSQARTIVLAPGTYLFVCNIPGHFKQGMFTVVTVAK